MIQKKYTYTDDDKKKIEKIMKNLSKEVSEVGEDGNMVCNASSTEGALIKFRRYVKENVGKEEAKEMKLEDIGSACLFLPDPDDENYSDDYEFYVSYSDKKTSDYIVYLYQY